LLPLWEFHVERVVLDALPSWTSQLAFVFPIDDRQIRHRARPEV
jgi:hypothetical protein